MKTAMKMPAEDPADRERERLVRLAQGTDEDGHARRRSGARPKRLSGRRAHATSPPRMNDHAPSELA